MLGFNILAAFEHVESKGPENVLKCREHCKPPHRLLPYSPGLISYQMVMTSDPNLAEIQVSHNIAASTA
jgi:hypothetical protein